MAWSYAVWRHDDEQSAAAPIYKKRNHFVTVGYKDTLGADQVGRARNRKDIVRVATKLIRDTKWQAARVSG